MISKIEDNSPDQDAEEPQKAASPAKKATPKKAAKKKVVSPEEAAHKRDSKLTAIYETLHAEYGPMDVSHITDALDLALYSQMLQSMSIKDAKKAFAAFRSGFVDWNEIRVSLDKDVQDVLKTSSDPAELSTAMKDFLQRLFLEHHHIGLEFLAEKNISEIRSIFKKLGGISESASNLVMERLKDYPIVPLEPKMMDCLIKLGIKNTAATALQYQKDLYSEIERESILPLYAYLCQHVSSGCKSIKTAKKKTKTKSKTKK